MGVKAIMWATKQNVGSPTKKLLLLVLAQRVRDEGEHAWCTWAGQKALAADAETSVRTVRNVLAEFERVGLISREQRRRPDGYRSSDLIRLNPNWTPPAADSGEPCSPEPHAGRSGQDIYAEAPEPHSPESRSPENAAGSPDQGVRGDEPYRQEIPRKMVPTSAANDNRSQRHQMPRGKQKIEPEEEPEDLSPQSSSRDLHTGPDRPPDDDQQPPLHGPADLRIEQAIRLLAQSDLDRRVQDTEFNPLLPQVGDPASWLHTAHKQRRDRDGERLATLARGHPDADAAELVELLSAPPTSPQDVELEEMLAALWGTGR